VSGIARVGPTTWVAVANVDTVDWSTARRCPIIFTRSGRRAYATDYTVAPDETDTDTARAAAVTQLLRTLTAAVQP